MKFVMKFFMNFFGRQIEEITARPSLRIYGSFLAATHLLTYFFWAGVTVPFAWHGEGVLSRFLTQSGFNQCWPGIPHCHWLANFSQSSISFALGTYFLIAFACLLLFQSTRRLSEAYFVLLILFSFKYGILFSNTAFIGNYHYMALVIELAYLFLPRKRTIIPICLVLFYVSAGFLKFNSEWLSGQALLVPPPVWIPASFLYFLQVAAVVFETFLSIGLLFSNPLIRWGSYAVSVLFHLISWQQVGFYYPLTMLSLTALFPISWLETREHPIEWRRIRFSHAALILLVVMGQITPHLFHGDSALTGQGRFFGLNMFDAKAVCYSQLLLHYKNNTTEELEVENLNYPIRTRCDILRYFNLSRHVCDQKKRDPLFLDLDTYVIAKRTTDIRFSRTMNAANFCSHPLEYHMFSNNDWIAE